MNLVTGGTGLVGSYLLFDLTSRGEKVRALIRSGKDPSSVRRLFQSLDAHSEQYSLIEWAEGDITDPYSLLTALENVEMVYHCAAMISFEPRIRKEMMHVNIEGTANVVNACLQKKVRKLCHVSSIASLGRPEQGGVIDEHARWKTSRRNSGYAVSKYGSEREVWRGIEEGLNAVIVNPSVILGVSDEQKATSWLFHSIDKMVPFYTEGVNGYVDVRDVAKAMILLMDSQVSGERFILNSENLSLYKLLSLAAEMLKKRPPFIPLGRPLLSIAWRLEWIRSRFTGNAPVITRENVRSAQAKSYYSAEKFIRQFDYKFLPVRNSLEDALVMIGKIDGR